MQKKQKIKASSTTSGSGCNLNNRFENSAAWRLGQLEPAEQVVEITDSFAGIVP